MSKRFCMYLAGGVFALVVGSGCQRGSLPPQANADQARSGLRLALETWKKGESTDELAQRSPSIYFNDPKVQKGLQLVDFKIDDGAEFFGPSARLKATLTIKSADGTTRERAATYLIDTSPAIVIVPD